MDPRHKKLYIKWSQSPRVELCSALHGDHQPDDLSESKTKFLIPSDLLSHRSQPFHLLLSKVQPTSELNDQPTPAALPSIELSGTPIATLEDFYIWSLSACPYVDSNATFENLVHLGIFAERFEIHALSNQVTDLIRKNLARGDDAWQLQAGLVNEVYSATTTATTTTETDGPRTSKLRELMRAALSSVSRSVIEGGTEGNEEEREEWKTAFLKHAQLGWNFIEAGAKKWDPSEFSEERCRYHVHEGPGLVSRKPEITYDSDDESEMEQEERKGWTWCPYERDECFPEIYDVEEEVANGTIPEDAETVEAAPAEDVNVNGTGPESDTPVPDDVAEEPAPLEPASDVTPPPASPPIEPQEAPPVEEIVLEEASPPPPPAEEPATIPMSRQPTEDVKSETEVSRTTIDDEVNSSLTWDEIIGKAKPLRTFPLRTVNGAAGGGGYLKTEGQPELQARMLEDTVESPPVAWGEEAVGVSGKVNGVDGSKAVEGTETGEKVGGAVGEKSVEEGTTVKATGGRKGKKKRNNIHRS